MTSTVYVRDRVEPPVGARVVDVATWAAEADAAEDRLVWLFTLLLIGVSAGYGPSRWPTHCCWPPPVGLPTCG
ncbi:hypothetical protein NKG94_28050 [Micromonospora sp. M12]